MKTSVHALFFYSFRILLIQSKAENVSPVAEINWEEYEAALGADVVGPMQVNICSHGVHLKDNFKIIF